VFELEAQSIKLFCPLNPHALYHPFWASFTFTTNHQEDRAISFKESIIGMIPL
jgi:hypothetical protein